MNARTRLWVAPLLTFAITACASSESRRAATMEADLQAVTKVIDNWLEAANANDEETMMGLVADDLEMIPPGAQPVAGPDAHRALRGYFEQFTVAVESSTIELAVGGDWALRRYSYEITLTPKTGGETIVDTGHGIHVFKRQTDGSWKLAKDIWTTVPKPTEAT
ncbi:MAG: hypothetical protein AMS21_07390 [Gemmatimonas sp. SG8_38_2]|nr:MAG: hypothetical protein AMS21_07390 [Gemmatimonas sp. SG8_38_2]